MQWDYNYNVGKIISPYGAFLIWALLIWNSSGKWLKIFVCLTWAYNNQPKWRKYFFPTLSQSSHASTNKQCHILGPCSLQTMQKRADRTVSKAPQLFIAVQSTQTHTHLLRRKPGRRGVLVPHQANQSREMRRVPHRAPAPRGPLAWQLWWMEVSSHLRKRKILGGSCRSALQVYVAVGF